MRADVGGDERSGHGWVLVDGRLGGRVAQHAWRDKHAADERLREVVNRATLPAAVLR
jgi:hypothetical protein